MKKLLLLLEHKIIKIGLIIVIVLAGFFLFYEQEIKEKAVNVSQGKFPTSSYLFQAYEGIKNVSFKCSLSFNLSQLKNH